MKRTQPKTKPKAKRGRPQKAQRAQKKPSVPSVPSVAKRLRNYSRPPTDLAGYDPTRDAGECVWDADAARKAVEFFPRFLRHHKGRMDPFRLEPWQGDIVASLFGWKRPDGTRRYREGIVAVPRKNGKTHLGAGIALYLLLCDNEPGAEVYSAAYSRDQASLVFDAAAGMVRTSGALGTRTKVIDSNKRILVPATTAKYRALPAEAANTHGLNPSGVLFDELHTQRTRELYDVLKTGTGARRQPLFLSITTAGFDRHSVCFELWGYGRQVRDGVIRDPHFLPAIYEALEDDDWTSEKVWRRVNPNLGVSVSIEFLREECEKAKALPGYENTFRQLYLNQWTEQDLRWIGMDAWRACAADPLPDVGRVVPCAGLDLSAVQDLTALALAWKLDDGRFVVRPWFWVPGESVAKRVKHDRVPYDVWAKQGHVTLQPGASINHDLLVRDVTTILREHHVRQIAVDRWNAEHVCNRLSEEGFEVVKFGQGFASMGGPSKLFEQLVLDRRLVHGSHPVLDWNAANVAAEMDAAGNVKPSKAKSTERIDGIVATIMALGVASVARQVTGSLFVV